MDADVIGVNANCRWSSRLFRDPKATRGAAFISALAVTFVVSLSVDANAQLFWKTDGESALWTSSNWGTVAGGPFTTGWTAGSEAVFKANSAITYVTNTEVGNVTVDPNVTVTATAAGTLNTGGSVRTINVGANGTLNWAGQTVSTAAGTGFIKSGDGIWNMGANSNAYTGGFTLNAGTVISGGNNTLGTGVLTINGGTVQSSGTRAYAPTSIVLGGNFSIAGTGGWTMNMPVSLGATTRTITVNSTGGKTWNGIVSGGAGAGLIFENPAPATATTVMIFTNASNSFDGPIVVNGGEVEFTAAGALGTGTSVTINGGRLALRGTFEVPSTKNLFLASGAELSAPGSTTVVTYNGVLADNGVTTGDLVKQGGGALVLGGLSTYAGETRLNNGTVRLASGNNRLPTSTFVRLGQAASANVGTLDLNGNDQTIAGLASTTGTNTTASSNTVTSADPATLTVALASGTATFGDGTTQNSGVITGAVSLVKSGAGELVLGGANTYTGTTAVNAGTLMIEGVQTGTGTVTVGSAGTIGGGGSIGGSLELAGNGSGFVFDPLKTLTVNGASVSFLDAFGIADLVGFSAAVPDGTYTLIDGTANVSTANLLNLGPGNAVDLGGGRSAYFETGSLVLQVVPEPSSLVLVGVGGLLAAGYAARRRWRKSGSQ